MHLTKFPALTLALRRALLVAALTVVALAPSAASAQSEADASIQRRITVTGVGRVKAPPDIAKLRLGLMTRREAAADAVDANNKVMKKVMSTLKEQGIAEKDMQTSSFRVSPRYDHNPDRRREVVGFRVSNQVHITVREVSSLGAILDAAIEAGANQVHGISFVIDDRKSLSEQARRLAVENAAATASQLVGAAGATLGRIITIRQQSSQGPRPVELQAAKAADAARAVPIAEGQQTIEVRVQLTYEIQ